jgi:hypothetical protein
MHVREIKPGVPSINCSGPGLLANKFNELCSRYILTIGAAKKPCLFVSCGAWALEGVLVNQLY